MENERSSKNPKTTSDEIRIIRARSDRTSQVMLIQALTRAAIAIIVVVAGAYLLIAQIPIPESAIKVALLILGAYFGSEAAYKFLSRRID